MSAVTKTISRRMRLVGLIAVVVWGMMTFPAWSLAASDTPTVIPPSAAGKRILILYSYAEGTPAYIRIGTAFRAVMDEAGIGVNSLFSEYLDLSRRRDSQYIQSLREMLLHKYAGVKIDVIVTIHDPALSFLLHEANDIFPNAPVLYFPTTYHTDTAELSIPGRQVVLMPIKTDFRGTLELALKAFPDTNRVVVVNGAGVEDKKYEDAAKIAFAPWQGQLEFEYMKEDHPLEEIIQRLAGLPPKTIIIFTVFYSDKTGREFIPREVVKKIAATANAPVFGLYDILLETGLVGGSLTNLKAAGTRAGRLALNILSGKRRLTAPVTILEGENTPIFDWSPFKRWRGRTAELPPGTLFVNRPPSLWIDYREYVIGTVAFLLVQSFLIVLLLIQRRRRRLAEAALRESEERFRVIFDETPDGLLVADLEQKTFIMANRMICTMLGYSYEDILRLGVSDIHPAAEFSQVLEQFEKQARGELDLIPAIPVQRKDGSVFYADIRACRINMEGGMGMLGMFRDITERKQAEAALAAEKERLAVTLRSIGDGVIGTDLSGRVTLVNKVAESLTGWSQEEAVGRPLPQVFQIIHEITRELREDPVSLVIKTGRVVMLANHTVLIGKDGREMIIADSAAPILDPHNALIGVVLVFRDITERTRDEESRKKLEAQLRQAQKMEAIGTLAGGIAHDFNNILGSIFGYTQLALDDAKSGNASPEFLNEIFKSAKRARDLVQQILVLSRQSTPVNEPIDISLILGEGAKLLRASLPANIAIQSEITTAATTILGDPTQIHQVLINLGTNAAHAMAERGGTLDISLTDFYLDQDSAAGYIHLKPGSYLKLTVSDTGDGIEGCLLDRIFDPFFTTKEIGKGSGMGLSIVQSIVKNHGGAISVYSLPGRGSTFNILLPVVSDKPELPDDTIETIPKGTESVLLVDDEPGLADTGKMMLERLGYKVTARTSAVEALGTFMAHPDAFDLLITDMSMPQMTGDKLAQEIMRRRPDLPVILCTGFSEAINGDKVREMGISGFLMKPIDITRLAKLIRQVLENRG
ncbi:MAG: PAS domain S-box protein [Deltaproteobacteria bacterium]|nr:PAS domain S-box protein [Deltaproteobacteria bacterium]